MRRAIGLLHARSNAEIASDLGISAETVKTHLRRLLSNLGARNRAHAVAIGFHFGLVGPEDAPEPPA